jgi:hypothetical protein
MSVRKIKTNIMESRSVPPSLPPEVVPLSGLADIVIYLLRRKTHRSLAGGMKGARSL